MLARNKTFDAVFQFHDTTLVIVAEEGAFVGGADDEDGFKRNPNVFRELLVAEAQATVFYIDVKYDHFQLLILLDEFARMAVFLGPAQIADVHEAINAFFQLDEQTLVGHVAHDAGMLRARSILCCCIEPWIVLALLEAEGHLVLIAVDAENGCLDFVTDLEEFGGIFEVL